MTHICTKIWAISVYFGVPAFIDFCFYGWNRRVGRWPLFAPILRIHGPLNAKHWWYFLNICNKLPFVKLYELLYLKMNSKCIFDMLFGIGWEKIHHVRYYHVLLVTYSVKKCSSSCRMIFFSVAAEGAKGLVWKSVGRIGDIFSKTYRRSLITRNLTQIGVWRK